MPSLAEIYLARGRAESDAELRKAAIEAQRSVGTSAAWSRGVGDVAQAVSGGLLEYSRQRQNAPLIAAEAANREKQGQMMDLQLQGAKDQDLAQRQAQAKKQAVDHIMGMSLEQGEDGLPTYSPAKVTAVLQQYNMTDLIPDKLKEIGAINASVMGFRQQQRDAQGAFGAAMANNGFDADYARNQINYGAVHGVFSPQEAKEYQARIAQDPANVKAIANELVGRASKDVQGLVKKPDLMAVNQGDTVIDKNNPQGGAVFTGQPKEATPVHLQSEDRLVNGKIVPLTFNPVTGKYTDEGGNVVMGSHAKPVADPNALGKPHLSEGAIRRAGAAFRIIGQTSIPTRIGEADRVAIMNESDKQADALGESPVQTIQRQLMLKADQSALSLIEKQLGSTVAAESKALKQIDLIQRLSKGVSRSDWNIINGALQELKVQTGNTPAILLANALVTFASEYGKIVEGSTGSVAGATVSAQEGAKRLITASMSDPTLQDVVGQMRQEMGYAKDGWSAASDFVLGRMGGGEFGPRGAQAPPPATSATPPANPKAGDTFTHPDYGLAKWTVDAQHPNGFWKFGG